MKVASLAFIPGGRDFIFVKLFIQLLRLADNANYPHTPPYHKIPQDRRIDRTYGKLPVLARVSV